MKKRWFKKLNLFVLIVLLIGQILLVPVTTTFAVGEAGSMGFENVDPDDIRLIVGEIDDTIAGTGLNDEETIDQDGQEDHQSFVSKTGDLDAQVANHEDQALSVHPNSTQGVSNKSSDKKIAESITKDTGEDQVDISNIKPVVDQSVIHTITAPEFSDSDYRPQIGDKVELKFEFTLPQGHEYGSGSILTYQLPEPLSAISGNGNLMQGQIKYGEYKVDHGKVIIEFNNKTGYLTNEGHFVGVKTIGEFQITAQYETNETKLDWEIKLPIKGETETITIHFKPLGGAKIKKEFKQENSDHKNSQFIEWTVNVNTEMADLGNEGKEFIDSLSGNHTFDSHSLEVWRYTVDVKGTESTKEKVENLTLLSPQFDNTTFSLKLTGKYAYEIKYKTIPGDTDEEDQTVQNNATFNDETVVKSTKISYGPPLTKSVSKTGEIANWTITVNNNRRTMAKDTTITDTWDSDFHELAGNITVTGLTEGDYSIVTSSQGFVLTLNEPVTEPFTITYATKPKDLITEQRNVTNTVFRSDRDKDYKTATASYSQNVIRKTHSGPNYQAKTIDWSIEINNQGYDMSEIILDDTFVHKNLKIVEGTFKINGELLHETSHSITYKDGDKKGGFILTLDNSVAGTSPIIITYTTEYDVRGVDNLTNYRNIGTVKWKTNGKDYSSEASRIVNINDQQKNKGYKSGRYNYQGKKFEWQVGINYNFDEIQNPIFKDTLTQSQKVIRDSIKVYKLDLTNGGNGKIIEPALVKDQDYTLKDTESHMIEIEFQNTINTAYLIEYKSEDADQYYEPQQYHHEVGNDATLIGENYSAQWKKQVTVAHSKDLITKDYKRESPNSAKLNWWMDVNWSQSTLYNVVIKDTVGNDQDENPNQMIYEDSFEICEMNFSPYDSTPVEGICHKPGEGLYHVSFDEPDSTFKIIFNEPIEKAYRIKYDSYFLGSSGEKLENKAVLSYESQSEDSGNDHTEKITANFTHSGSASNKKGQLQITKIDKDDDSIKLSGAEFELWTLNGDKPGIRIETVSTDVDGVYTFKTKVGMTKYYLKETKAPKGYSLKASEYYQGKIVDINEELTKINIENTKVHYTFKTKKVDENGEGLSGAIFKLLTGDGNDVPGFNSLVSDENGWLTIHENLEPGKYQLVEIKAPAGYKLDATPVEFEITADQTEPTKIGVKGEVINKPNEKSVTLLKFHENSDGTLDETRPLEGAEFTLYDEHNEIVKNEAGDELIGLTTNEYGELIVEDLASGGYYFLETKAPSGYQLDRMIKHEFTIIDGQYEVIKVGNKVRPSGGGSWTSPNEPEDSGDKTDSEDPSDPNRPDLEDPSDPNKPDPEDLTDPSNPNEPKVPVEKDETGKENDPDPPDQLGSGDLNKPGKSGAVLGITDKQAAKEQEGNVLPGTSTNLFNLGLFGVTVLLSGLLLLRLSRRREY